MNLAMTITMNGLIRTLRATAHDLAEAVEGGYAFRDSRPIPEQLAPQRETDSAAKGDDDERAGR